MGAFSPPEVANRSDPDVVGRAVHDLAATDLTGELPRIRAPFTIVYASPDPQARAAIDRSFARAYAARPASPLRPHRRQRPYGDARPAGPLPRGAEGLPRALGRQHRIHRFGQHVGIIERVMEAAALLAAQRRADDQVGDLEQVAQLDQVGGDAEVAVIILDLLASAA